MPLRKRDSGAPSAPPSPRWCPNQHPDVPVSGVRVLASPSNHHLLDGITAVFLRSRSIETMQ